MLTSNSAVGSALDSRTTTMPINSARLYVLVLLACGVASAATQESPADAEAGADYVEEMVVTAERLEKGDWPTGTIITQTYNVRQRGMLLYELGRYEEALPLLLVAAERGFKWPQAMAADIYLHGRGGVPRDLRSGLGWLGVAASPRTSWQIDSYFRQAMAELPDRMRKAAEATVDEYRERWDSRGWRVSCRRVVSESANSVVTSLRLNKRLRCAFMDEVPVCRQPYLDDMFGPPVGGVQLAWECDPVGKAHVDVANIQVPAATRDPD